MNVKSRSLQRILSIQTTTFTTVQIVYAVWSLQQTQRSRIWCRSFQISILPYLHQMKDHVEKQRMNSIIVLGLVGTEPTLLYLTCTLGHNICGTPFWNTTVECTTSHILVSTQCSHLLRPSGLTLAFSYFNVGPLCCIFGSTNPMNVSSEFLSLAMKAPTYRTYLFLLPLLLQPLVSIYIVITLACKLPALKSAAY